MLPFIKIAQAASIDDTVNKLYFGFNKYVINPIIVVLFALATFLFVYGLVEFLAQQDNQTAQDAGKQHMLYGIIGMTVMATAVAIKTFIVSVIMTLK